MHLVKKHKADISVNAAATVQMRTSCTVVEQPVQCTKSGSCCDTLSLMYHTRQGKGKSFTLRVMQTGADLRQATPSKHLAAAEAMCNQLPSSL